MSERRLKRSLSVPIGDPGRGSCRCDGTILGRSRCRHREPRHVPEDDRDVGHESDNGLNSLHNRRRVGVTLRLSSHY